MTENESEFRSELDLLNRFVAQVRQFASIRQEELIQLESGIARRVDALVTFDNEIVVIEVKRRFSNNLFSQIGNYLQTVYEAYRSYFKHRILILLDSSRTEFEFSFIPGLERNSQYRALADQLSPHQVEDLFLFTNELEYPEVIEHKVKNAPYLTRPIPNKPSHKAQSIFISYRRIDSAWATGRIADYLKRIYGHREVFHDIRNIDVGSDWVRVIQEQIAASNVLLVIMGPNWLTVSDSISGRRRIDDERDTVRAEISAAIAENLFIVPVLLDGATMPLPEYLPEDIRALADKNAATLNPYYFDTEMQKLRIALDKYGRKVRNRRR